MCHQAGPLAGGMAPVLASGELLTMCASFWGSSSDPRRKVAAWRSQGAPCNLRKALWGPEEETGLTVMVKIVHGGNYAWRGCR